NVAAAKSRCGGIFCWPGAVRLAILPGRMRLGRAGGFSHDHVEICLLVRLLVYRDRVRSGGAGSSMAGRAAVGAP
ncbi:MAG TPA: hypothetical protein VK477_04300, partial [Acidobacteriota bacterium]|nr:hypothetical protein [Acidobacteriota bacterium]